MQMFLEIASPGKQGVPAHGLPHEAAPKTVTRLANGGVLFKGQMTTRITLHGAETYQGRYSAKWNESSPLAALSNGHTFSGTAAPTDSLPRISIFASDLDAKNLQNGAVRLQNLLSWLAFCTLPWTKLGQPPLLHLRFGFLEAYGYLTDFDPQITEWMLDDRAGKQTGLPYAATFTINLKREPLGLAALEPKRGLPKTTQAPGGAGGLGAARVPLTTGGR